MKIRLLVSVVCFFVLSSFSQAASVKPLDPPIVKQINLNKADVKTLSKSVKGIGLKRAQAIINYRQAHGDFKSVTELAQVPGFGQKFVNSHANDLQNLFTVK